MRRLVDNAFRRFEVIPEDQLEARADFARYLCVVVAGFIERSVREIVVDHVRRHSRREIVGYVESQLLWFRNANSQKISDLLNSLSPDWKRTFDEFCADGGKDAIDSTVANRNKIAHGDQVGVSYHRIRDWYADVVPVIEFMTDLLLPETERRD